jgi:hypothetical protein
MSDRTQGSVRTGSRTGDTAPAQGTATGQQPAADGTPSVGSTQSIPGANTARTQAAAADGGASAAAPAGPASGTQTAVPPVTGAQPAAVAQPATGTQPAAAAQPAEGAQPAAGAQPAGGAAKAPSGKARGPRRARLQLRHIDTFSALKISLVLSIAMFFIWMVAVGVLYGVLSGLGVFETLNDLFGQLGSASGGDGGSEVITPGIVFGGAAVIGAINIVLMTALCTVAAFIYNMCSDLVGGLEVTLSERD